MLLPLLAATSDPLAEEVVGAVTSAVLLVASGLGVLILLVVIVLVIARRRRPTHSKNDPRGTHEDPWWDAAQRLDEDP
jgi:hypothetical protein